MFVFVLPLLFLLSCGSELAPRSIEVEYLRVIDGDTIVVNLPELRDADPNGAYATFWRELSVRLAGIDTPEIHGACKEEIAMANGAKTFLQSLLANAKSVQLRHLGRDKYFRLLADVYVDEQNLSHRLMKTHLAVPYSGGKKKSWCGSSAQQANTAQ